MGVNVSLFGKNSAFYNISRDWKCVWNIHCLARTSRKADQRVFLSRHVWKGFTEAWTTKGLVGLGSSRAQNHLGEHWGTSASCPHDTHISLAHVEDCLGVIDGKSKPLEPKRRLFQQQSSLSSFDFRSDSSQVPKWYFVCVHFQFCFFVNKNVLRCLPPKYKAVEIQFRDTKIVKEMFFYVIYFPSQHTMRSIVSYFGSAVYSTPFLCV